MIPEPTWSADLQERTMQLLRLFPTFSEGGFLGMMGRRQRFDREVCSALWRSLHLTAVSQITQLGPDEYAILFALQLWDRGPIFSAVAALEVWDNVYRAPFIAWAANPWNLWDVPR